MAVVKLQYGLTGEQKIGIAYIVNKWLEIITGALKPQTEGKDMLTELLGKKVKVFLNCTQWNEYAVSGTAIKIDGNWLYLKTKKATEIISMPEIKRVTVFD